MDLENEIVVKMALDAAKDKSKTWLGLAKDLGVGRTTVYSWKYGIYFPSCEQFLKILIHIDALEFLLEAIQKSRDATAIVRPFCKRKKIKDHVRQ